MRKTFENVDTTSGQADKRTRWGSTVGRRQTVQDGISTSTSDHARRSLNGLRKLGNLLVRKGNRSRSPRWLTVDNAPESRVQDPNDGPQRSRRAQCARREGQVGRG